MWMTTTNVCCSTSDHLPRVLLLAEYVWVEKAIGHSFRKELPLTQMQKAVRLANRTVPLRTGSCNQFRPEVPCARISFHPALARRPGQLPTA